MMRIGCLLLFVVLAPAQDDPAVGLPEQVREIFAAKCTECHGSDVARPKGRFGYVDDLERVAKKYVKPGDVEESELWWYLTGEQELMPPKKAKSGPMTLGELAVVRWWILDGAKASVAVTPSVSGDGDEDGSSFLARSHVLIVHFPIALVFAALLAEVLSMWRGSAGLGATGRFCIALAAVGALLAAFSGWPAGDAWNPARVDTHRWLGVAAMTTAVLAALVAPLAARGAGRARTTYRVLLVAAAVLVGLAGHQGGLLVHGEGYFGL